MAVAAIKDMGSQRTAPAMISNAPRGVRVLHFPKTHAIPPSNA
jgi:hypothetical protein